MRHSVSIRMPIQGNFSARHLVHTTSIEEVPLRKIILLILFGGLMVISGCQTTSFATEMPLNTTPSQTAEPVTATQGAAPMSPSLPTPADAGLQNLIERIKEDLATRLAISVEAIEIAEAVAVEWSDSSLDCPQPGMSYLPVITPGYRILLRANDQAYEYHSNRDSYFVFCENRIPPIIPAP